MPNKTIQELRELTQHRKHLVEIRNSEVIIIVYPNLEEPLFSIQGEI